MKGGGGVGDEDVGVEDEVQEEAKDRKRYITCEQRGKGMGKEKRRQEGKSNLRRRSEKGTRGGGE